MFSVIALALHIVPSLRVGQRLSGIPWQTVANIAVAVIALCALVFTILANSRSEKLFVAANEPLIDVTPIGIIQSKSDEGYFASTYFSVANYSGFKAFKIGIDLKYGEIGWITEWLKADQERNKQSSRENIFLNQMYDLSPQVLVPELEPGMTTGQDTRNKGVVMTGILDLEAEVCTKGKDGLPLLVRVTWQNAAGHTFDEIHKYRLLCTKVGQKDRVGYSFTFVPEGIVSRKDVK